jgi:PhnB protein
MERSMMQVYVKGSIEAVELYQKAFNATLTSEARNSDNTFLHAELDVVGHIIAISERNIEKIPGNTMQFCFQYGEGNEEAVKKAYEVLQKGSQILRPLGPCFFSPLMADFIDKFGVHWCLFV